LLSHHQKCILIGEITGLSFSLIVNRILVYFELENRTWRQHLFTNALRKNSYIGKKCRNDVQKFTPTKISGDL